MMNTNLFFYIKRIRLVRILPITFIVLSALISITDAATVKQSGIHNSASANRNQTVELKSNVIVEEALFYWAIYLQILVTNQTPRSRMHRKPVRNLSLMLNGYIVLLVLII